MDADLFALARRFGGTLGVLIHMIDHADNEGFCRDSRSEIADALGVSTDTIKRECAALADAGAITPAPEHRTAKGIAFRVSDAVRRSVQICPRERPRITVIQNSSPAFGANLPRTDGANLRPENTGHDPRSVQICPERDAVRCKSAPNAGAGFACAPDSQESSPNTGTDSGTAAAAGASSSSSRGRALPFPEHLAAMLRAVGFDWKAASPKHRIEPMNSPAFFARFGAYVPVAVQHHRAALDAARAAKRPCSPARLWDVLVSLEADGIDALPTDAPRESRRAPSADAIRVAVESERAAVRARVATLTDADVERVIAATLARADLTAFERGQLDRHRADARKNLLWIPYLLAAVGAESERDA